MALTQSAKNKQGSGNVPHTIFYDVAAAATDTGSWTLAHAEGVIPTKVIVQQTSGTAAALNETVASRTATNVVVALGAAAPAGGVTARVYIEFGSMDAPAVI